MPVSDRIAAIQAMIAKSPSDVFLHYSLGMEYAATDQFAKAVAEFRNCIQLDPNYLAAYVEAGKAARSDGKLDAARELFATGMDLAAAEGERHMRDFIQQQLDGLPKG